MRQLATIQKIREINPIVGADRIVVAKVLGWECVVPKEEYCVDQLIVFIEIDSIIPDMPCFAFLKPKDCTHEKWRRIKTIRLKGQISQGLVMPLKCLDGLKYPSDIREHPIYSFKEGDDVTALLGVTKYEPPIPEQLLGEVRGTFPCFLTKSDETRCVAEETVLNTDRGTLTIRNICENKIQCKVLSKGIIKEYKPILAYSISENTEKWYELQTENNKLLLTRNHKIYLPIQKIYKPLHDLRVGDIIETN